MDLSDPADSGLQCCLNINSFKFRRRCEKGFNDLVGFCTKLLYLALLQAFALTIPAVLLIVMGPTEVREVVQSIVSSIMVQVRYLTWNDVEVSIQAETDAAPTATQQ